MKLQIHLHINAPLHVNVSAYTMYDPLTIISATEMHLFCYVLYIEMLMLVHSFQVRV